MSSAPRIFVTGATGLVGSQLVEQLVSGGFQVVALVRESAQINRLVELQSKVSNLEIMTAELSERNKLSAAMSNSSVVIHTAASIAPLATIEEVSQVNVEGTRSVAEAAIAAGVTQFIHISSLSVIMGATHIYDASESAPYVESREAYANSKIAAEKLVLEKEISGRINVTVLRPGFIYGPNERAWMPRVIGMLQQRRAMLVGKGDKETNVIYVGNLCRAILSAILRERSYGQIYNLTDGQRVSKRKLFDTISDQLELPRVAWYIPEWFAHFLVDTACLIAPISPPPRQKYSLPVLETGFATGCLQSRI